VTQDSGLGSLLSQSFPVCVSPPLLANFFWKWLQKISRGIVDGLGGRYDYQILKVRIVDDNMSSKHLVYDGNVSVRLRSLNRVRLERWLES